MYKFNFLSCIKIVDFVMMPDEKMGFVEEWCVSNIKVSGSRYASYIPSEYHSMTVEFLRNKHTQKSTIGFGPYFSIEWIGPNTLLLQERQHGLEELYIRNTPIPYQPA
jgi:hypothetical protein